MRQSLNRGNTEIYAGENQRARRGSTTRRYPDRFKTMGEKQILARVVGIQKEHGGKVVLNNKPLDPTKQDGVVYKIPCECGKV